MALGQSYQAEDGVHIPSIPLGSTQVHFEHNPTPSNTPGHPEYVAPVPVVVAEPEHRKKKHPK